MSCSPEELKQKYLRLRKGIDVPFPPESLPYAHTVGGAVISLPNYELIDRSIRAMQRRSGEVLQSIEQGFVDVRTDWDFVDCMKKAPVLDNQQLEAIARKEQELLSKNRRMQETLRAELVNAAFAHLLSYAKVHIEIKPNILYHYYAHKKNNLVLSLIAPEENPPFNNYVGSVRQEDDDKLHVIRISSMYKKRVLDSGEKKGSNF